jgi:hypothetical protein
MKRKWLWVILFFLLLAALVGYRMFSRINPDVVQTSPDFVIAATDLIRAFEQDSSSAAKQYANKIVQVSGTVMSVDDAGAVVLGEASMPSVVVVGLEQRHMADLQKIKAGSLAVLQGIYSGYERSSSNPDDLLSGLGTTIQLRSGGLKEGN